MISRLECRFFKVSTSQTQTQATPTLNLPFLLCLHTCLIVSLPVQKSDAHARGASSGSRRGREVAHSRGPSSGFLWTENARACGSSSGFPRGREDGLVFPPWMRGLASAPVGENAHRPKRRRRDPNAGSSNDHLFSQCSGNQFPDTFCSSVAGSDATRSLQPPGQQGNFVVLLVTQIVGRQG